MLNPIDKKRKIEDISKFFLKYFKSEGFEFVDLDLIIDTDLLTKRSGEEFKKSTITYKDLSGKEISLRPDLTISTAIKYIQDKNTKTKKYSYFGSAFKLLLNGKLKVFNQIGCELINSKQGQEDKVIQTFLKSLKKYKKKKVYLGDIGIYKSLIDSLDLPERWKLRLKRHYPRTPYFNELIKRLETNYDLDQKKIDYDYNRLEELKKINGNKVIAGRKIQEIITRFEKKKKDPRDNFMGAKSAKIIKDFLKIKVPAYQTEKKLINFFTKHYLKTKLLIRALKKIKKLDSKISKQYNCFYQSNLGREIQYYTGIVFSIELNNKEISRGGEYNNLMKTLGYKKQINAFGGAIDLNQLLN
tara:strand:+ start:16066 stop:17136 length:1071 start_codon:yes stop_codon:yes gene_type:complete